MRIIIIKKGDDIISPVCSNLINKEADYSSNLVVFPGKRPSHFLKKALYQREERSILLPSIFSMDEFVDFVYQEVLKLSKRKLEAIDSVKILYDIHINGFATGKGHFLSPDTFFPLGLKIYQDLEELHIEGCDINAIKDIDVFVHDKIPPPTLNSMQSLSYFYEEFYKRIQMDSFSTRASRYRTVADMLREDTLPFERLIFAGFFGLSKIEKELFRRLYGFGKSIFIFQEGNGIEDIIDLTFGSLSEIRSNITAIRDKNIDRYPEINFYKSPDSHGQFFALSNILKKDIIDNREINERTVIVLPSSTSLFALMHNCLSLLKDEQYNISMGYPLYRTPLFGFLSNLMDLAVSVDEGRFYIPDYLRFVLHPYTKNIYFKDRADITRIIVHAIEERLLSKRTMTFLSPQDIEDDLEFLRFIMQRIEKTEETIKLEDIRNHIKTIHKNTINKFLSFENIADFAKKCMDVLYYIYENSTAKHHPLFYPFAEAFIGSLNQISVSLMKDVSFEQTINYFNLFKSYIKTCHVPFWGTPLRGLQVLGLLETRNIRFDRVFIVDMNEGVVPDVRKEDTLLPLKARQMLKLPTYEDRERLIEYYLNNLIIGAREVNIFFVENERNEMSRFVQKIIWNRQVNENKQEASKYIKSIQYKASLRTREPEPVYKTPEMIDFLKRFSFNASSLDDYLKCQLRFFYSYVINLSEKEEISSDIQKYDIGNVVHEILSEYFGQIKMRILNAADLDLQRMDIIIDRIFEKNFGRELIGANYLLKRQIRKRMFELIEKYYVPLIKRHEFRVIDTERRIQIFKNSFNLKGRIDIIEERDGKTFIIDYKTSSNPNDFKINLERLDINKRESWSEFIKSIQLPFYHILYVEDSAKGVEDVNCSFLLLGRRAIDEQIELPLFDGNDQKQKSHILTELIFCLLNEIIDISLPFIPANNRKENCKFCDFRYMCGIS